MISLSTYHFRTFCTLVLRWIIFSALFMLFSAEASSQDYPGQGGRLRGNSQGNNLRTVSDSIKKPPLRIDYFLIEEMGFISRSLDTLVQRGLSVDLLQDDLDHLSLGNFFSAILPVRFEFQNGIGNKLGVKSYDIFKKYVPTGTIISPNRPVVKGYYGSRFQDGHRNINLDFSRTFARNITFGFRVYSGKSVGQFNHQESAFNALEFNIVQRSKKDRRRSYMHFHILRNTEEMNGGLVDPADVFNPIAGGNASYSVNNTDALLNLKSTTFRLGTSITLGVDTIVQKWSKIAFAEIGSEKDRFRHIDPDVTETNEALYLPIVLSKGIDTVRNSNWNIYEKIGLSLKNEKISLTASLQFIQNTQSQDLIDNVFRNQVFINAESSLKISKSTKGMASLYQELGGLNERNFTISATSNFRRNSLIAYFSNGSEAPGLFQSELSINANPVWEPSLSNQTYNKIGVKFDNREWNTRVHIRHVNLSNYIYLNPLRTYINSPGRFSINSLELSHKWSWKFLNLSNLIYLQDINDESILSLPQISTRHDLSLDISFFKRKLKTRLGTLLWFRSSYITPSFHPFLNDFYFDSSTSTNANLRIAPYIKANISGLEIYLGMDDLENALRKTNRFEVNNYPVLDSKVNLAFRIRLLD